MVGVQQVSSLVVVVVEELQYQASVEEVVLLPTFQASVVEAEHQEYQAWEEGEVEELQY